VRFRDPTYAPAFVFPARRLPGAEDPPNVLPPNYKMGANHERLGRGGGGRGGRGDWRPRFGFVERTDQAFSGDAARR